MNNKSALQLFGEFLEALGHRHVVQASLTADWEKNKLCLHITELVTDEEDHFIFDTLFKELRRKGVTLTFDTENYRVESP